MFEAIKSLFEQEDQQSVSLRCEGADQTVACGKALAQCLSPGAFLAFYGDLGSGKTTFIKGVAQGLELPADAHVTSPTFVLMHVYKTKIPVYHFDLYRLKDKRDLEQIGYDEFVEDPQAISCVEWADRCEDILPENAIGIEIKIADKKSRQVTIQKKIKVKQ